MVPLPSELEDAEPVSTIAPIVPAALDADAPEPDKTNVWTMAPLADDVDGADPALRIVIASGPVLVTEALLAEPVIPPLATMVPLAAETVLAADPAMDIRRTTVPFACDVLPA